jgi:hypothetical protein
MAEGDDEKLVYEVVSSICKAVEQSGQPQVTQKLDKKASLS